jgi:uncharacterized repeat protein (TIGR03803 family)
VEGADLNFYGTTYAGGSNFLGGLFEITSSGTLTTLYAFSGVSDGANPAAPLVQGSDGSFYGTTSGGDLTGGGTVFRLGSPTLVAPQITSFARGTGSISFTWSMVSGQTYQVQAATNLTQASWSDLGNPVTGFVGTSSYLDSTLTNSQRFYRILTYPP